MTKVCYGILLFCYVPLSPGFQHLLPWRKKLHLIMRDDIFVAVSKAIS